MVKIESNRMDIIPMTLEELQHLIRFNRENQPELSQAFEEMYAHCKQYPQELIWYIPWKLCLKENSQVVGTAGFKGVHKRVVEIGYGIEEDFWGRGYATEAVEALCDWALQRDEEVRVIEAETGIDNLASQKVLYKSGFIKTGQMGEEGPRFELKRTSNHRKTPAFTQNTIPDMEDMSFFTYALIFDDLLIVAQKETNCFILKSSEGLIMIDAIWPAEEAFHAIIHAITEVGWDTNMIKKLVLTHGHVDHTGCGKWFVEEYHVRTYLSKEDDQFWKECPAKPDRPETWKDYEISDYVKDGDVIQLGNKRIYVYETPGHTPGGLSFIFDVRENGEQHMAALWGGTTPPWTKDGVMQYLKSLDYFMECASEKHVDVALSNHTAIDQGLERIAYSKDRYEYMPNIYVIGESGFQKYCEVFKTMSYERLKGLNDIELDYSEKQIAEEKFR